LSFRILLLALLFCLCKLFEKYISPFCVTAQRTKQSVSSSQLWKFKNPEVVLAPYRKKQIGLTVAEEVKQRAGTESRLAFPHAEMRERGRKGSNCRRKAQCGTGCCVDHAPGCPALSTHDWCDSPLSP
jgi:hypothetical protein